MKLPGWIGHGAVVPGLDELQPGPGRVLFQREQLALSLTLENGLASRLQTVCRDFLLRLPKWLYKAHSQKLFAPYRLQQVAGKERLQTRGPVFPESGAPFSRSAL